MIEDIFDGAFRRVSQDEPPLTLPEGWENTPRKPGPGWSEQSEVRYLVPGGAQWAATDDVNDVLSFMTDQEVMQILWDNLESFGDDPEGSWEGTVPGAALYYYGTEPVMQVTIKGELLLLTGWERGTADPNTPGKFLDKYPPLVPTEMLQQQFPPGPGNPALRPEDAARLEPAPEGAPAQ